MNESAVKDTLAASGGRNVLWLMIAPTPFFSDRGCHIRVLNSYLRLQREGERGLLLTYPLGRDIEGVRTVRPPSVPGYRDTSPGFNWYRPFLDALLLIAGIREVLVHRPVRVYAHLHEGAAIALVLKLLFRLPFIFDAQGSLVGEMHAQGHLQRRGAIYRVLAAVERFLTRRADHVVTSTEALASYMASIVGRRGSISVVPDLPDHSLFHPSVEPAELELPPRRATVAYLGGMQPYKGMEALLEAISRTPTDIHFLLMGYPVEYVRRRADELRIEGRLTLTGTVRYEAAPGYLKLADVAVSPKSLESGEANAKIHNYLAMGLPVVCFDTEETRSIVGSRGYYARAGDVSDFASKILEAVADACGGGGGGNPRA